MGDGFQSIYKRHTPFSMVQYAQPVTDKITVEPKGDLLSYVYFTKTKDGAMVPWDWEDILEFEWWIGDRMIDRQDVNFIRYIYPMFMARTFSKFNYDSARPMFLPLTFSFCQEIPFPIISLKYHSFEIRLKKGSTFDTKTYGYQCYLNYIFLDEPERMYFALNKQVIPIHTVKKISNSDDIQLYQPIKFIATPTVKIPDEFVYSVQVNNQFTRKDEPYSGSELMFHTDYSKTTSYGSDSFPPSRLTGETTFLTTAYGRGVYGVTGSSTHSINYPWNVSDVSNSTYWQTTIATTDDVLFVTSATSNSTNAWQATNSTGWKSEPSYGVIRTYIVTASSNIANAWTSPWISDQSFGTNASLEFKIDATSNAADAWKAFDGNVFTNWVSANNIYASGLTGDFVINASSNSATTNVVGAFTGRDTWASNASYGVYTTAGIYTSNQYNAFSITNFYKSANLFAKTTNAFSINLSSSTGNVILAFNGRTIPWTSNINVATYGFSTIIGTYTSNASTNDTDSWKAFDGDSSTQWKSNPVYAKIFSGTYNVSASSNTTNAYLVSDSSISTQWNPTSTYGLVIPAGQYSATAVSNASGYIYTTMNTEPEPWTSNILYGNVLAPGQYVASASSNTSNAWRGFALNNTWTGTNVFGQIRFNEGTYVETFSNGQSTKVFGRSGQWTSNAEYGFSLPSGTYTVSNAFANAAGIYTNTGIWGGRPISNTEFSWSSNAIEFFTTPDLGTHIVRSSRNTTNAWRAFNQSQDFDFQVPGAYKQIYNYNPRFSNGVNTIINTSQFATNGDITVTTSSNYSRLPIGTYTLSASSNTEYAWQIRDNNPNTFWTPTDDSYVYDTSGNFYDPAQRYTITATFPQSVSDILASTGGSIQVTTPTFSISSSGISTTTVGNDIIMTINSLNRRNYTIAELDYDLSGSQNISTLPSSSGSSFNFTTNNVFSQYNLGYYEVAASTNSSNAWKAFSKRPIQFKLLQSVSRSFTITQNTSFGGTHEIRDSGNARIDTYTRFKTFKYLKINGNNNLFFYVTRIGTQIINGYFVDSNNNKLFPNPLPTVTSIDIGEDQSFWESDFTDADPYLTLESPSDIPTSVFPSIIADDLNKQPLFNSIQPSLINRIEQDPNFQRTIRLYINRQTFEYPEISINLPSLPSASLYGFFHNQPINTNITCTGVPVAVTVSSNQLFLYDGVDDVTSSPYIKDFGFQTQISSTPPSIPGVFRIQNTAKYNGPQPNYNRQDLGPTFTSQMTGYCIEMDFGYNVYFNRIKYRTSRVGNGLYNSSSPIPELANIPQLVHSQAPTSSNITVNAFYYDETYDEWVQAVHSTAPQVSISNQYAVGSGYSEIEYITEIEYKTRKMRFVFNRVAPMSIINLYASIGYNVTSSGTTHFLRFNKTVTSTSSSTNEISMGVTSISTPIKFDGAGLNPYLGLVTGSSSEGASYEIEFPYAYPLNQLNLTINGQTGGVFNVYNRSGSLVYQNLQINTTHLLSSSTSDRYKFVFTQIYGAPTIPTNITLTFTNSATTYGWDGTSSLYRIGLARVPTYLYFPYAPASFVGPSIVVSSVDDDTPYGGGPARSTVYLELLSLTRYLPFFYFQLDPPVSSVSISTYENGQWSSLRTPTGSPFQIPIAIDGTNNNYNTSFKGIRIQLDSISAGSPNYTGRVRVFDRSRNEILNLNIFTKPIIKDLTISAGGYQYLPIFQNQTNTITTSDTSFISAGTGNFYIGNPGEEDYVRVDLDVSATLSISSSSPFKYTLSSEYVNFIWTLNIGQRLTSRTFKFIVNDDAPLLSGSNVEFLGGGTYSGTSTTSGSVNGEWIEYTFPKPIRIESIQYTYPERPDYVSGIRGVYKSGATYVDLPGTSDTFRIIVTRTFTGTSGTAIIPAGSIVLKTADGRKSLNTISNVSYVITSGLDANVRPNGSTTSLFRMKQYNFGNEPTLRGVFPPVTKFHDFEFYGNVYTPYSLQAGNAVIFSSSRIISAWIGTNAVNPTDGNKLTAIPTKTFKSNTIIGTYRGNLTPTSLRITNLNTLYTQPKIVIIRTSTPILFFVSTYQISGADSVFTGTCSSSGPFDLVSIEFNYDDTEIITTSNLFLINQNIPAGTEIPLRVTLANVNNFDLYFSSNSGDGLSNINNVYTPIFPGGPYNGFGNCFTTLTRPAGGNLITNYFIKSNTITSWTANGELVTLTAPTTTITSRTLNRPISTLARLEILRTAEGNLYPTVDALVYRDSSNRPVSIGPGTFTSRIPIGNFEATDYGNIPLIFNPYKTGSHVWTGTFTINTNRTVNRVYAEFDSGSMRINNQVINRNAETTYAIPISGPFIITGTNRQIVYKILLFDSNGLVVPQTSNGIVVYEPGLGGGNYTGPETTLNRRGDWVDLTLPGGGNVYKYDIVSNTMPSGWSLQGYRNSTTSWSIIEEIPRYYSSNTYSNLIQTSNVGPWDRVRLVVSNTYTGFANIQSVNVYSRNLSIPYVEQTVPLTVAESPYVDLNYSFPSSTYLDTSSITWTGNTNNTFTINFSRPTQIKRFECSNIIPYFGLVREEYTSSFNYISFSDLLQRPVISVDYTNSLPYTTANSFFMYGFINIFSPTTTISISGVSPSTNVMMWIGTNPATGTAPQIMSTATGRLSNIQSTIGYKQFCLFSNGSTSSMLLSVDKDKSTVDQDFTGWFTPYPNPVSIRLGLFSNAWGANVHRVYNITGTSNIIPDDNYFIRANVTVTNITTRPRLSNITFYNDRGPINIPGFVGGYGSEWIQLQVPSNYTVNSYSIRGALNSNITLSAGNSEGGLRVISQSINSTNSHIQIPNSQNTFYRFQINETPSSRLSLRNIRLYDTAGFEINPYMTSNTFNSSRKDLGECLTGKYNISASSRDPTPVFDSSLSTYETGANYNNGNYSINGRSVTLTNRPVYGEWVQIEFPQPVNVNVFSVGVTSNPSGFANVVQFCASSDGFNWITANSTTRTTPVANSFYNFTSLLNTPYKFYRMVVSNLVGTVSKAEFGKLNLFDSAGRRLNSYYSDDVIDVNTFGGARNSSERIRVQIPQNKKLKYVIMNGGRLPTSININSSQTVIGNGVYELTNSIDSSLFTININSVEYNRFSSTPAIIEMKLLDERGKSLIPSLADNIATYNEVSLSTPYVLGTFKCSNLFAFDDNPETSWVSQGVSNVYFEFPRNVDVTRYTIVNPSLTSWRVFGQTINERLTTTNTYVLSAAQNVSNIEFRVTGSGTNIVGGLVFYDSLGRINPTMTRLTENITSSSIFGGVHTTSNDTVTFNVPSSVTANSYTITARPFPASWNVYAGTTLVDQIVNYYTNTFTESFSIKNPVPGTNYRLVVTETQNSSNISINNFQLYDSNGQFLIPQFTSNTVYSTTEYSSEMLGFYEPSASIGENIENAFDPSPSSVYVGAPITGAVNHAPGGLVMYYSNNAIDGCVDFRTFKSASKGILPQTQCVWRGPWAVGAPVPTTSGSVTATLNGGILEIRYPGTGSFDISPNVFSTSFRDWIQIRMPSFTTVTSYRISGGGVTALTFMGSENGRNWVTLDNGVLNVVRGIQPARYMYYRVQFDTVSMVPEITSFDLYNNLGKINSFL